MKKTLNWAIYGAGQIAKGMAYAMNIEPSARPYAVASRNRASAERLVVEYNFEKIYTSLEEILNDRKVDAVYISTPNHLHYENAKAAILAKKHVLVEKPFAITKEEGADLICLAEENNVFFMEALWTKFLPSTKVLLETLDRNIIGDVLNITSSFGLNFEFNPEHRLFNPKMGGGALLDVGIYTINMAVMILGWPDDVSSCAYVGETGVDYQSTINFKYDSGAIATLNSSCITDLENATYIAGTKGSIKLEGAPCNSNKIILTVKGESPEVIFELEEDKGLQHELKEFYNCIKDKKLESEVVSHDYSLTLLSMMDMLRFEWGVKPHNE